MKKTNKKEENKIINGIKKFFNNPIPIFISLIAIICVLLMFISGMKEK